MEKASKAESRILQGAREALAYAKGEADTTKFGIHIPSSIDVKKIRKNVGLTQTQFAARYGFSVGRIRDWEQGRYSIDAPSRILLTIIENEPDVVNRALRKALSV
ncbi:helix-turn-helix domain-containing protein [Bartonella schoenbuchensis]|uniref:DNA-binding protein n=3 Tax=Bartonella schoenbuchensis TaxID=165694 RepID=N6V9B6_9HYPH|nr:helix-turn-helix domain-containing protein [Bartonella schoenbuchensis]AQX31593.1 putative transcriptional regulator [Bartonella schoenbuchensis R1]ENN90430.1 putative DNA-binding protein [Bartonella schoenbuchensis m07a]CBI82699.1 putative DNA-binding protein [Bartonella schoenbuchensis R1]CDP79613.1 putative zinc finger/helix-turn-helix protein, YgiT family [Bartonella schoenbuchensis]CDP79632.1 putative zinc finger/helix-turn-helix protein, YgiT family [Bartonella schoenbuchensis]